MELKQFLEDEDEEAAHLTMDWSMKWPLTKSHETKSEWFGNAGIEFDQSVFEKTIIREGQWFIETACFSTIFNVDISQNSQVTAALLQANVLSYHESHPEVKFVDLQSDNAAAYKSSGFIGQHPCN